MISRNVSDALSFRISKISEADLDKSRGDFQSFSRNLQVDNGPVGVSKEEQVPVDLQVPELADLEESRRLSLNL
jgi:hypothetical protein